LSIFAALSAELLPSQSDPCLYSMITRGSPFPSGGICICPWWNSWFMQFLLHIPPVCVGLKDFVPQELALQPIHWFAPRLITSPLMWD